MSPIGKNMMLITTYWGNDLTFKMMPVANDCPYMEVIFDTNTKLLVVITNQKKENLQMVPKLDENGDMVKAVKPRANSKAFKEKQIQMVIPQEFYLIDVKEQKNFIETFAVNADTFDTDKYLNPPTAAIHVPEQAPLLDATGTVAKKKTK